MTHGFSFHRGHFPCPPPCPHAPQLGAAPCSPWSTTSAHPVLVLLGQARAQPLQEAAVLPDPNHEAPALRPPLTPLQLRCSQGRTTGTPSPGLLHWPCPGLQEAPHPLPPALRIPPTSVGEAPTAQCPAEPRGRRWAPGGRGGGHAFPRLWGAALPSSTERSPRELHPAPQPAAVRLGRSALRGHRAGGPLPTGRFTFISAKLDGLEPEVAGRPGPRQVGILGPPGPLPVPHAQAQGAAEAPLLGRGVWRPSLARWGPRH